MNPVDAGLFFFLGLPRYKKDANRPIEAGTVLEALRLEVSGRADV